MGEHPSARLQSETWTTNDVLGQQALPTRARCLIQTLPQHPTSLRPPPVRLLQRQAQEKALRARAWHAANKPHFEKIRNDSGSVEVLAVCRVRGVIRPRSTWRCVLRPPLGRVLTIVPHLQRNVHLRDAHRDIGKRLGAHSQNRRISRRLSQQSQTTEPHIETK